MGSTFSEDNGDRILRGGPIPQSTLGIGATLINGTYIIEEYLARGGMGEVYRAKHVDHGTQHAIKILLPHLVNDRLVFQLFIREARELGRINSDVIVKYQGFLRDESGLRCLIMEFVDGESLDTLIRRRRFETTEVFALLERIGTGLAVAHDLGIVHRDISPENVIIPDGGIAHAKLIDFGIAKSAELNAATLIGRNFSGKFSFASPEQAGLFDGEVDARSDIYSLGLVLAAAALGFERKLDMGSSLPSVLRARQTVPDLTAIPPSLRGLLGHMLQPRPSDRPPFIRTILEEVRARNERSITSSPVAGEATVLVISTPLSGTDENQYRSWLKRRPSRTAVAAGGLLVGVIVLLAFVVGLPPADPSAERIQNEVAAAMKDYRCSDLTYVVGPHGTLSVRGYVHTDQDLARLQQTVNRIPGVNNLNFSVRHQIGSPCEALERLKRFIRQSNETFGIALLTPQTERHADHPMVIDVRAPAFDSYIYVDYFTPTGNVVHVFPNRFNPIALRPRFNQFTLGRPPLGGCWTLSVGPGEHVITVIATEYQLFSSRPASEIEPAREYLDSTSERLERSGRVAVAALSFELDRDRSNNAIATGCPPNNK